MITQGPWKWHKRKHSNTHFLENESETNDDFAIIDDGSAYGEYGAVIDVNGGNAQLIAAAPELLDALQETIHEVGYWLSTQKPELKGKIESAINKALGGKQ